MTFEMSTSIEVIFEDFSLEIVWLEATKIDSID